MPSDPVRSDRMRSIELRSHRTPSDPVRSTRPDPAKPQPFTLKDCVGRSRRTACAKTTPSFSRIPRDSVFVEDLIGREGMEKCTRVPMKKELWP
ncbi:hypothetical protein GQ600_2548 [Phytophthora cactorum]|nr:hypothetical protein GQ600_2548 [Phytophthora cactorum]